MAKWWQATAASYFIHVSKARITEVVTEAAGAQAAAPLQSLKKDGAASGAEKAVASTGWLPRILRLRTPGATDDAGPDADTDPDIDPDPDGSSEPAAASTQSDPAEEPHAPTDAEADAAQAIPA